MTINHHRQISPNPLPDNSEAHSRSPQVCQRRDFLGRMALLAGALLFASPLDLFAAQSASGNSIPKRHRAILHFIKRYSRRYWVSGPKQTAARSRTKTRTLHVLARIDNMPRLAAALATLPFASVLAGGNTLSFKHRGLSVVIENVPARDFSARVAQIESSTRPATAAHSFI